MVRVEACGRCVRVRAGKAPARNLVSSCRKLCRVVIEGKELRLAIMLLESQTRPRVGRRQLRAGLSIR